MILILISIPVFQYGIVCASLEFALSYCTDSPSLTSIPVQLGWTHTLLSSQSLCVCLDGNLWFDPYTFNI